jgi:hypothetical protein
MAPTYAFIATLGVVIGYGVLETVAAGGSPAAVTPPPSIDRLELLHGLHDLLMLPLVVLQGLVAVRHVLAHSRVDVHLLRHCVPHHSAIRASVRSLR